MNDMHGECRSQNVSEWLAYKFIDFLDNIKLFLARSLPNNFVLANTYISHTIRPHKTLLQHYTRQGLGIKQSQSDTKFKIPNTASTINKLVIIIVINFVLKI